MAASQTDPLVLCLGPWLATEVPEPIEGLELAMTAAHFMASLAPMTDLPPGRQVPRPAAQRLAEQEQQLRLEIQRMLAHLGDPMQPDAGRGRRRRGPSARHAAIRGTLRRLLAHLRRELDTPAPGQPPTAGAEAGRAHRLLSLLTTLFMLTGVTPPATTTHPLPSAVVVFWLPDVDDATRHALVACMLQRGNEADVTVLEKAGTNPSPSHLQAFGLWPLTAARLRPWLLHPARPVRETGLRLMQQLEAAPRPAQTAHEEAHISEPPAPDVPTRRARRGSPTR